MTNAGLRERLQAALGDSYHIERELGGGGMSRVFVAREVALGRTVALKVLSPELAAEISGERFRREIQMAARLQHPHVVPVLTAGSALDLPYYTMPFVEGESLRARIVSEGALPLRDVTMILRDVARALEYAHAQGVVHRDIKPDNVLMAGNSVTVTDFGIAKAISESRVSPATGALTSAGVSLGTPSYIAPEQASADVNTDHRADIYSFGCMAYELLTGRTPFGERPPAKLIVAHLSEKPEDVLELRPDMSPRLAALVMRCLEKDPDDRPQSAAELLTALDAVTSTGGHDAEPVIALTSRRNLGRALAIYAASFIAVAVLSRAAIIVFALPDWVFPGALIVMALGLPMILFTGLVHHQARVARTRATHTPGGTMATQSTMAQIALKASPVVTWRRIAVGGAWSVGIFTLMVAAWMTLRALGIGPAASLLTAGTLSKTDQILVSDFQSPASDTGLGPVVTEALRGELAKSKSMSIVPVAQIRSMLARMQLDPSSRVDLARAREMARREGMKAIVDGQILAIGSTRVIQASLVSAQTGDVLASFRETANTENEVVSAIDRIARDMRERVGESLRNIRATPGYDRVTTASFDALRKFVEGDRAYNVGDVERGRALLNEAIALDSGFAMAYRKLAVSYLNDGAEVTQGYALLQKAFDNRARLGDEERLALEGYYYSNGPRFDAAKAISAYERLLEISPDSKSGLVNLAVRSELVGQPARAESLFKRMMLVDSMTTQAHEGLIRAFGNSGRIAAAESLADVARRRFPRATGIFESDRSTMRWSAGKYDSSLVAINRAIGESRDATAKAVALSYRAHMLSALGHVAEADRDAPETSAAFRGVAQNHYALETLLLTATRAAWYRNDRAAANRLLDDALRTVPLSSMATIDEPLRALVDAQLAAGRIDGAKATLANFLQTVAPTGIVPDTNNIMHAEGVIALAEKKYDVAIQRFRHRTFQYGDFRSAASEWPYLAEAYDRASVPDSALAIYERYLNFVDDRRLLVDGMSLGPSMKRLGELYEARGDRNNAAKWYSQFVALWKSADRELQPAVRDVETRFAHVSGSEPAKGVTPRRK